MDAIQDHLHKLGRYRALAGYWNLGDRVCWWDSNRWSVPQFLRCPDGCRHTRPDLHGNPLFQAERLGNLHYAALMKLFDADRHLVRLGDALDGLQEEPSDAESCTSNWCDLDDALGAFFWCLMGSLDALAGEAALMMGCAHAVFDAHFSSLENWMQEPVPPNRTHVGHHWRDMNEVLDAAFAAPPQGWRKDLSDYRNLLTHRPFLLKSSWVCRLEDRRMAPRLPSNTAQLPSDAKRFGAFRSDDVLSYLPALWYRVATTVSEAHGVLLETLETRTGAPGDVNDCELHWEPRRRRARGRAP